MTTFNLTQSKSQVPTMTYKPPHNVMVGITQPYHLTLLISTLPALSPCPHSALAALASLFLSQASTLLPQGLCSYCSLCLEHKRSSINKYLLNRLINQVVAYVFKKKNLLPWGRTETAHSPRALPRGHQHKH